MIYLLSLLGFTYTGTTGPATVKDNTMSVTSYLNTTIALVPPKSTPAQLVYTKDTIIRVSARVFGNDSDMTRNFITLVAIESRFEPRAKSSAGAVGLAQVIPKYAKEFGSHCGLVFEPSDMDIPELNLLAGACQFKHLVDTLGSTSLALVAYNAGRYSKSLKSMKLMSGAGNIETANYVAKHTYVKELTLGDNK
jgi:hypothetical protein